MPTILLVDDVYSSRSMTERVLIHVGRYTVFSFRMGAEALGAVHTHAFDALVLDINMADTDGFSLLKELRAAGVQCPAIAYTARNERTPGEYQTRGFTAYASKAGNLDGLLQTVRAVLHT